MTRAACLVTLVVAFLACASVSAPWKRTVRGSVVAFDHTSFLLGAQHGVETNILIVKVEGASPRHAAGLFKKIFVESFHLYPVPRELYEQGHRWRFAVSANRDLEACTASLRHLIWIDEEAEVSAPDLTRIECLHANRFDVKMIRKP